jgi:hypothetical protein
MKYFLNAKTERFIALKRRRVQLQFSKEVLERGKQKHFSEHPRSLAALLQALRHQP